MGCIVYGDVAGGCVGGGGGGIEGSGERSAKNDPRATESDASLKIAEVAEPPTLLPGDRSYGAGDATAVGECLGLADAARGERLTPLLPRLVPT